MELASKSWDCVTDTEDLQSQVLQEVHASISRAGEMNVEERRCEDCRALLCEDSLWWSRSW
jgi:hypothetical protein